MVKRSQSQSSNPRFDDNLSRFVPKPDERDIGYNNMQEAYKAKQVNKERKNMVEFAAVRNNKQGSSMITPMVMKGFHDKCAQLGINANVMLKYAKSEYEHEARQESGTEKTPPQRGTKERVTEGAKEMYGKAHKAIEGIGAQRPVPQRPSPVQGAGQWLHEKGMTDPLMGAAGGGLIGAGIGGAAGAMMGKRKGRAKRALLGVLMGGLGGAALGGGLGARYGEGPQVTPESLAGAGVPNPADLSGIKALLGR